MSEIQVYFVTNRNYQPNNKQLLFGSHFNPDGVAALRFGCARFSLDGLSPRLIDVNVYDETKEASEAQGFEKIGSPGFLDDLKTAMVRGAHDTVVFVHGFNVDFREALTSGARLGANLAAQGLPVNIVVFTWPSDGTAVPYMSYYSDREDARASGPALARAFLKLQEFVEGLSPEDYCDRSLHLVAHSMGNYVLRNGLQALIAKDPKKLIRLFNQIVLAAADEDDDTFETDAKLRLLTRITRQVTVYFNPNDRALVISDKTKGNPDRLGSDGPRLVDLIPKKVALVDCRQAHTDGDEMTRHSYYLGSRAVAADLRYVLAGVAPEAIGNRTYLLTERSFRITQELPDAA